MRQIGGLFALLVIAATAVVGCMIVGWGVEALWNDVAPSLFGWPELSWTQASSLVGLFVIFKFVGAAATAFGSPRQKPPIIIVSTPEGGAPSDGSK